MGDRILYVRNCNSVTNIGRLLVLAKVVKKHRLFVRTFGKASRLVGHIAVKHVLGPLILHVCVKLPYILMRSYGILTENLNNIRGNVNLALLCLALAHIPGFVFWTTGILHHADVKCGIPKLLGKT